MQKLCCTPEAFQSAFKYPKARFGHEYPKLKWNYLFSHLGDLRSTKNSHRPSFKHKTLHCKMTIKI